MMQQINPGLMKVLAAQSQINPLTPEGNTSVAANVLAQAGQAPGIAAIGQQTQAALPSMMRNAQDDQAKQMLEAAQRANQPAGIAGLNIPMGQYAEGGVVGYNGDTDSYVDPMGGVYGGRTPEVTAQEQAKLAIPSSKFDIEGEPGYAIDQLVTILKNDPSLSSEERTAIAKEIQNQYIRLGARPPAPPPRVAEPSSAPLGIMGTGGPLSADALLGEPYRKRALAALAEQTSPEQKTWQQLQDEQNAALRASGLPINARQGVEARWRELLDRVEAANKADLRTAWESGILQPGAMNLAQMFGNAARTIGSTEKQQRAAGIEYLKQQQKDQADLEKADRLEVLGFVKEANALRETVRQDANKRRENIAKIEEEFGKAATTAGASMYGADARIDAALMRGLGTLGQAKPPVDIDATQMAKFREMAKEDIPDVNPFQSPYFLKYLKTNEPELLERIQSDSWWNPFTSKPKPEELIPVIQAARDERYRELVRQSKFGAAAIGRAVPYNVAEEELNRPTR